LSSDVFTKQTTEEGAAKESSLGVGSLRALFKKSRLKEGEDPKEGEFEEETQKAISPPAWCAFQLADATPINACSAEYSQ
jgi:hypothetical protein